MKTEKTQSVIHDWVSELPFTQQALLMLSLRGPDGLTKHNTAKKILYYIRGLILKPAYADFTGMDGFMWTDYENFNVHAEVFFRDTDNIPMHFYMHLIHAIEVVAYNHPNEVMRERWLKFYEHACNCLHMNPETKEQLNARLFY